MVASVEPRSPRQRQAILGKLPRITRADGSPIRVLVVDDEPALTNLLKMALPYEGWEIEVARNGQEAMTKFAEVGPDLLVLDIMLPDIDGFQILKTIRESGGYTPTLFLTARDSVMDRVTGLTAGADDYLTKPFSPQELLARIRAVLRRRLPEALEAALESAGLKLDPATRRVTGLVDGQRCELKIGPTEFRLLHFLMTHPERVHSRAQMLDRVWGDHVFIEERTVDVHIKRQREALQPAGCAALIETVRGAGYRLTRPVEQPVA